jgi:hypothetical protein
MKGGSAIAAQSLASIAARKLCLLLLTEMYFSGVNTANRYLILGSVEILRAVLFVAKDLRDFGQGIAMKLLLKVGVVLQPETRYFGRAEVVTLWG